jgi:hypothetical protein
MYLPLMSLSIDITFIRSSSREWDVDGTVGSGLSGISQLLLSQESTIAICLMVLWLWKNFRSLCKTINNIVLGKQEEPQ